MSHKIRGLIALGRDLNTVYRAVGEGPIPPDVRDALDRLGARATEAGSSVHEALYGSYRRLVAVRSGRDEPQSGTAGDDPSPDTAAERSPATTPADERAAVDDYIAFIGTPASLGRDPSGDRLVALAVDRLFPGEAAEIEAAAGRAVRHGVQGTALAPLLEATRRGGCSAAFKMLVLLVARNWLVLQNSENPLERAGAARTLVRLREIAADPANGRTAETPESAAPVAAEPDLSLEKAVSTVYQFAVRRAPGPQEIDIWRTNFERGMQFHEFVVMMANSAEARAAGTTGGPCPELNDGEFVQWIYELVEHRGAHPREIEYWMNLLRSGKLNRTELLSRFFAGVVKFWENTGDTYVHDALSCHIMGTNRFVNINDWKWRAKELKEQPEPAEPPRFNHRFAIRSEPKVLVSAIASLYRGGDFIEQFMDNITSQTVFDDYCELVIIDADSPENEYETIKRYVADHKNINYMRINYRLGIYDAWNVGAKASRGDYLTNTNLDDLRRSDSLELQAGFLDNLPFVDVVYQDFYYSFDPRLSWDEVAAFDYKSDVPVITGNNMLNFNSPHNAPMWRRRLHDEIGYFDTHFRSAGDYDFWMRCVAAGKTFYKINDPHVCYYQNPDGISTRPDTRGVIEGKEVLWRHGRKMVSPVVTMPFERFCSEALKSTPPKSIGPQADRYTCTQTALRDAARRLKFNAPKAEA